MHNRNKRVAKYYILNYYNYYIVLHMRARAHKIYNYKLAYMLISFCIYYMYVYKILLYVYTQTHT